MFDFEQFFWEGYYKSVDATSENFETAIDNKWQLWNWASPKFDEAFAVYDKFRTITEGLERLTIHELET